MKRTAALTALVAAQYGVVTRGQLLAAGWSTDQIDRAVVRGELRRLHRGVYLFGQVEAPLTRAMAASLACGPAAAVSRESAARVWTLLAAEPDEVVAVNTTGSCRAKRGIRIHRVDSLGEVAEHRGIRVTTVTRTLLDLATYAPTAVVERAVAEALAQRLVTRPQLRAYLDARAGVRGCRRLEPYVDGQAGLTRSEAERRFLSLLRRTGVPEPEVNVRIGPYEVDFLWRRERVVVEVDGFRYHSSSRAFEADRRRDTVLTAEGCRVLRITWRQLTDRSEAVMFLLGQVLSAQPTKGTAR